jgi:hypothetical protein
MALASPPLALKQVSARIFGAMITSTRAGWRDGAVQLFKGRPLASAATPLIAVNLW